MRFLENSRVGYLRYEGPVIQAGIGQRILVIFTGRSPDIQAQRHMLGLGEVVAGDDGCEVEIEQVGRSVTGLTPSSARACQGGAYFGPNVRHSDAGGEIPPPRAGVPGLH
ncbi:hypothetical protein D3C71_1453300 [compost metagenome]